MEPIIKKDLKYRNKGWLEYQYITLDKTQQQIADETGMEQGTIAYWTRRHNLKKVRRINRFKKFEKWKLSMGCKFCGYKKNAHVLRFHHEKGYYLIEPRNFHTKKAREELETGNIILLCSNCHLELHNMYGERKLD